MGARRTPVPTPDLEPDELLVIREYRTLREQRHGDLEISVKDGKLIKLWKVEKVDLSSTKLREVPR
jgi:hypothetical protein